MAKKDFSRVEMMVIMATEFLAIFFVFIDESNVYLRVEKWSTPSISSAFREVL